MNRLKIHVKNITRVLAEYDQIKVYRADSELGSYTEVTTVGTRIEIIPEKDFYFYDDSSGNSTHWYKISYFNSITLSEGSLSDPMQAGEEEAKIGYTFGNYTPSPGEWGEALTPDDMRYTFAWGIDMVASDELGSEVDDEQLKHCVRCALEEFEKNFMIDIRKKIYKTEPDGSLIQGVIWRDGVDYTDEEYPYDFDKMKWMNCGFVQLRHKPIISIEKAGFYSPWDTLMLDVKSWVRIYPKPGQLAIVPKGPFLMGVGYAGSGILMASPHLFGMNYAQGFKFDYTTGLKSSDFIPNDLRNAIGMLACINLLNWMGDGLMAGYSSSSVSLDGLSEGFSSTQSATNAYFGARILQYIKWLKEFEKSNKYKYANIPLGFISGG